MPKLCICAMCVSLTILFPFLYCLLLLPFIFCSGHHLIEFLMVKWGLKCVKLLDGFSFMPSNKASGLSGNIQLAEIVLNCESVK